jgi:hypothetical protein
MARKSAESARLQAVTNLPLRLDPPETLSAEEAELWRAVVNTKPVDWFQADSAPLLVEYCRAKIMCDRLADMLAEATEKNLKSLIDMRDKESRRLATLGCKLRLTQQSRYTPGSASTASKKSSAADVWQFGK